MFLYRRRKVTLENYSDIFSACSPDIRDEIRSAVLDDTPIGEYIEMCGNDSYKLAQVRLSLREGIHPAFINRHVSAVFLYTVRSGHRRGIDMDSLLKYITERGLRVETKTLEMLAVYVGGGTDISMVDFTVIPVGLVNMFCEGLQKGYPMWLIADSVPNLDNLTQSMVYTYMRGMQLGIDIKPFLDDVWDEKILYLLFSNASKVDINKALSYITSCFSYECVSILLQAMARGTDIRRVSLRDSFDVPVYNEYQMTELISAIEDNCVTDEMFNPSLSDMDIASLHKQEYEKRNKKLNVSLKGARKC